MRTGRAIIHKSAGCASEITSLVQACCHFLCTINLVFSEPVETYVSILFFSNLDFLLLNEPVNHGCPWNARGSRVLVVKEVVQFLIVNLEEGALDDNVGLVLSLLHFLKDQLDNSRDDAQIILLKTDGVPATHCESLSTTCLTIS